MQEARLQPSDGTIRAGRLRRTRYQAPEHRITPTSHERQQMDSAQASKRNGPTRIPRRPLEKEGEQRRILRVPADQALTKSEPFLQNTTHEPSDGDCRTSTYLSRPSRQSESSD